MTEIDRLLEKVQRDVELKGKSGSQTVFMTDVTFSIPSEAIEAPSDCDVEGAICDVSWFFKCAREKRQTLCGNPDTSFWIKHFGKDAIPYGSTWDLKALKQHFDEDLDTRRGILHNFADMTQPPCVLTYQFHCSEYKVLDCTVTLRSSDVVKMLPQDVFMTSLIHEEISELLHIERGSMTFNLSNAHVYYEDLQFTDEHTLEFGE